MKIEELEDKIVTLKEVFTSDHRNTRIKVFLNDKKISPSHYEKYLYSKVLVTKYEDYDGFDEDYGDIILEEWWCEIQDDKNI